MLKRIDELGRIVVPAPFRDEIGVSINEYVDLIRQDDKIIIKKADKMLSKEAIQHLLETSEHIEIRDDYSKGFEDALKLVLGKGD